jgi:hypothetical protein
MSAVDDVIANIRAFRAAADSSPLVVDADLMIAALQALQTSGSVGGMKLLGAKLYDPVVKVSKVTTALLAMTALDTVNLRLTVTVPASGFILVRMQCAGLNSTIPAILLGVMQGATVIGRTAVIPRLEQGVSTEFVIPGLTPGPITLDAAYSVKIVGAGSSLNYGGPDDAIASSSAGAFCFEIWDPNAV